MKNLRDYLLVGLLFTTVIFTSCSDDDDDAPAPESSPEVITDLKLIFTNASDNSVVEARAQDPDGAGNQELAVLDTIKLDTNATYTLTFEILNKLDTNDIEDIGDEIKEEDNEHQLFFAFTNNAFSSPRGDGNIDAAGDPLNYNDLDENGNNVGLNTTWTTDSLSVVNGSFRVRLQHQPEIKSSTTGANDGDTDIDVDFVLNIKS